MMIFDGFFFRSVAAVAGRVQAAPGGAWSSLELQSRARPLFLRK
jgi:hypothetical protein